MKIITASVFFLLLGIILIAGCTGPAPAAPAATPAPAPVVTPVAEPVTSPVTLPATTTVRPVPVRPEEVSVTATTRIASDNPYLEYLNIRKRTFDYPIPNCFMQTAFPGLLKENYGINQIEPKLTALSEDDYLTFIRKNTETNAENSQLKTPPACAGSAADPTWNFIEVRVILDPTNVRPNDYTITQNVWADEKVVAKFPTTQSLSIGKKVTLLSYIPIHSDEVDLFDTVEVTYTRL